MKCFFLLFLILFCSACDSRKSIYANVHHVSEDRSSEILYLNQNVALFKEKYENIDAFSEKQNQIFLYSLVAAHWLNPPTLSNMTGDEIDEVFVHEIQLIGFTSPDVIYGYGEINPALTLSEMEKEKCKYFIMHNKTFSTYDIKDSLLDALEMLKIKNINILPPSDFMKKQTRRLRQLDNEN